MSNFTEPQFWIIFGILAGGLILFGALISLTYNGDQKRGEAKAKKERR